MVEPLSIELPIPPAIVVTLSAPSADVNRALPARCDLDVDRPGHVAETTVRIAGVRYYRFPDTGDRPCLILDAPNLQLLDARGRPLRTITYVPSGSFATSAPRQTLTLRPGQPAYLNLSGLARAGFGVHPPALVCPTSASLRMTFPYSPESISISGPAGRWSTYKQLGRGTLACGLLVVLPLAVKPTDIIAV